MTLVHTTGSVCGLAHAIFWQPQQVPTLTFCSCREVSLFSEKFTSIKKCVGEQQSIKV